jgi:hypothetical protein
VDKRKVRANLRPDDKEQSERFITTAIERGADRLSSPADRLIGKLAKMPPEPRKPPKKD